MKSILLTVLLTTSLLIIVPASQAQDNGFGIGASIGSPNGISYKLWTSENTALAGATSFFLSENASSFYTHLDYLVHTRNENLNWEIGQLSFYYGGGARFIWRELGVDNTFWALRLPTGLNFTFAEAPVDFFFELAPTIDISPNFAFGFNGGIGFRYFLN